MLLEDFTGQVGSPILSILPAKLTFSFDAGSAAVSLKHPHSRHSRRAGRAWYRLGHSREL